MTRNLVDISAEDLGKSLAGCAVSTRDSRIRRLRSVWSPAVRKGWTTVNIADRLDIVGVRRDEVEVYHADEVESLLRCCEEHDKALVPYLALCAFAGLRPEREAFRLDWSDIHLDDQNPQIVVRPELSKMRRRRFVDISGNLAAWLRTVDDRTGGVCKFSEMTLRRKRQANLVKANETRKKAGHEPIRLVKDGLRHSYCSAWLARHGDITKLLLQSGHSNAGVMFRHYHKVTSANEAAKYWAIVPKAQ